MVTLHLICQWCEQEESINIKEAPPSLVVAQYPVGDKIILRFNNLLSVIGWTVVANENRSVWFCSDGCIGNYFMSKAGG